MAMDSHAKIAGHAAHPILVTVPLGLFSAAAAFDGLALASGDKRHARTARAMIGAGLIGGAFAAPPGWIDWFAIPDGTRAKRIGLVHGLGNVALLGMMGASYLLRSDRKRPGAAALALSFGGIALAGVTGWLGGELVGRLGVGVTPGAHLDAPSSLDTAHIGGDEARIAELAHHAANARTEATGTARDDRHAGGVASVTDTAGRDITAAHDRADLPAATDLTNAGAAAAAGHA